MRLLPASPVVLRGVYDYADHTEMSVKDGIKRWLATVLSDLANLPSNYAALVPLTPVLLRCGNEWHASR